MIPNELMRQVHRLRILTGRVVNEVFAGEYESAFKGRGMEFAEVREYQPGDEVRTIDWNVTARAGAPFVKQFVEERELTVMLVVDLSSSGRFGSVGRLKNELAAEVCAVLAFAATKNNDRVGLLIFTAQIELYIPPKKGIRHVLPGDPRATQLRAARSPDGHPRRLGLPGQGAQETGGGVPGFGLHRHGLSPAAAAGQPPPRPDRRDHRGPPRARAAGRRADRAGGRGDG